MKIKRFLLFVIFGFITACTNPKGNWKTIELGRYLLDVPQDFKVELQSGIDSKGGLITNGIVKLNMDFGYYTDTLLQTPDEYLSQRWFVVDAGDQFMKPGITYDADNSPKINVVSIRPSTKKDSDKIGFFSGSDYIAVCRHDGKMFNWPVRLPENVKRHTIRIDTFNHLYRRIEMPKQGYRGETAIYMRDKRSFNINRGNFYGIVIGANSLTTKQQALVLKIFETLRPCSKNQATQ
ncbi:hypothetical protein [Mucilaginibacter flavidus]|uniref:hypothetical protein n=1 Tax=Mucilaginibacter flavidus TaxID=2949309 RepID=UPI0020927760|nr:hypothetical protein [Mucilaginibacter flavidus]MCO5949037.1 hypothetical protein [Mucilaginibacter flavidus]